MNVELTADQCQIIINIINSGRYTPHEWEEVVKPIITILSSK
jgi:hypothetical protein